MFCFNVSNEPFEEEKFTNCCSLPTTGVISTLNVQECSSNPVNIEKNITVIRTVMFSKNGKRSDTFPIVKHCFFIYIVCSIGSVSCKAQP